jgi:2-keto-4-pentenoate hydratase/2-oxohepta-3-ene-1,7-dioic acid hydratase in catechol pathway
MRLATIQTPGGPRGVALVDGQYVELGRSVREHLEAGMPSTLDGPRHDARTARLLAPIPDPPKVICIGLNYRDHAAETGQAIPREPVVFSKFPTAVIGPEASIVLPPVSHKVDFEAELVLVIGKGGKNIPRDRAMSHLAGLTVGHDVSARDWQVEKDGRQWLLGKTFDTFAPMGPHLVTLDEAGDPCSLDIRLRLNGMVMQESNTSQLIFRPDELIAYISQVFTLQPGDVLFTGTPPGVGIARKPPVWLKPGDVCEVEIQGLGVLRNPVVAGK